MLPERRLDVKLILQQFKFVVDLVLVSDQLIEVHVVRVIVAQA